MNYMYIIYNLPLPNISSLKLNQVNDFHYQIGYVLLDTMVWTFT